MTPSPTYPMPVAQDEARIRTRDLGRFRVHALESGMQMLDGGAMFGVVPKPLWERRAPADERNRIQLATRPLLVRPADDPRGITLLIDAGIGGKMDAKSTDIYAIDRTRNITHSLAEAGLTPADIRVVLASHLHFDHCGGFTERDEDGRLRPAFGNAAYYVRDQEWHDATHPHERNRASYLADDFLPIQDAGRLHLYEGDADILPGVTARWTGGHARSHQVIVIQSGGRTAVFTADMIPTTAHIDEPWIMGYDLYPMETLAFKRQFVREAIDGEYLIFFEHDPKIAAGYIREKNGRKYVEPLISDS